MELFGKDIPCGCDQRKEVMFTQGNIGPREGLIVGAVLLLLFATWRLKSNA